MPSPAIRLGVFGRFLRSHTQLAAVSVLGLCVLLAVGVQVYSSLNLSRVLSENWRGAYDLLVTNSDSNLTSCTAGSDTLVAPNFVSFGGTGGISLDQLNAVRAVGSVAVAAPIGVVGQISTFPQDVGSFVPISEKDGAKGYELSSTLVLDDGARKSELSQGWGLVQTNPDGTSQASRARLGGAGTIDNNSAVIYLNSTPPIPVTVVAIDPVAEQQLLGQSGEFLTPLILMNEVDTSTVESASVGISKLLEKDRLQDYPGMGLYMSLASQQSAFFPMIINDDPTRSMSITLTRKDFAAMPGVDGSNLLQRFLSLDPQTVPAGQVEYDISRSMIPFSPSTLEFPAPGFESDIPTGTSGFETGSGLHESLAGAPEFDQESSNGNSRCELRALPQGDFLKSSTAPRGLGDYHEQTYRSETTLPSAGIPVAPVPVGSYAVSDLDLGSGEVSYVPLGAYESGETEILGQVSDPDSAETKGVLRPGISGLGITTGSAGALTTLEAAKLIRGDTPIDAIRVRVAGVDRYDDAGRAKVARVADEIRSLGLHVDVVAGSSLEAVSIYVPDYFPTSGGGWEDLGWVRQGWSALDAAAKVQSSLDVGGLALLIYAVVGGTLLAGAASVLAGFGRRRAVGTLRQMGWTGAQAIVWIGGEYLVGAGLLALVSASALGFAWLAGTLSPALSVVVGVVVAGYCAGGALSAFLAMREPVAMRRKAMHKDVQPVATAVAFGLKNAVRNLGVTATTTLTLILIGIGAGVAVGAIMTAVSGAGATLLAGVAVSGLLPLHLALALLGVSAGLVLAAVGRRADRPRRSKAIEALSGMGWDSRAMNVSLFAELGITVLLALVLAPAAVVAVSLLAGYPLLVTLPVSILGTVLAASIILSTRTTRA